MADWRLDQVGRALDDEAREAQDRPLAAGERPVARASAAGSGRSGRWLRPAAIVLLAVAGSGIGYAAWQAFRGQDASVSPQDVPLIRADRSPVRVQPERPGGLDVPHQDRLVMHDEAGEGPPTEVEALRPPPEQPLAEAPEAPPAEPAAGEPETEDPIAALLEAEEAERAGGEEAGGAEAARASPAPELQSEPDPEPQPGAAGPAGAPATATVPVEAGIPDAAVELAEDPAAAGDDGGDAVEALIPRRDPDTLQDEAATATTPEGPEAPTAEAARPQEPAPASPPIPDRQASGPAEPGEPGDQAAPSGIAARPEPDVRAEPQTEPEPGSSLQGILGSEPVADGSFLDMVTALTQPDDDGALDFAPPPPSPEGTGDVTPPGGSPVADPRLAEVEQPDGVDTTLPPPGAAEQPPSAEPEPEPEAAPEAASGAGVQFLPDPNGTHRVQIVAVPSQDEILPKWNQLLGEHPQLLSGLERHVEPVDLGARGIWYRVQAGPLSAAQADALCDTLKALGTDCIVRQR